MLECVCYSGLLYYLSSSSLLSLPSSLFLLQELLPPTRQLPHHFDEHFSAIGLDPLVKFRQAQQNAVFKQRLREEIEELLAAEAPPEDVVERCQQHMASTSLSDVDVTVLVRGGGVMMWRRRRDGAREEEGEGIQLFLPALTVALAQHHGLS